MNKTFKQDLVKDFSINLMEEINASDYPGDKNELYHHVLHSIYINMVTHALSFCELPDAKEKLEEVLSQVRTVVLSQLRKNNE